MRTTVVVPTYNEIENIERLLRAVRHVAPRASVLVVDDGSPDGTADRAAELGVSLQNVGRTLETMLGSRIATTFMRGGEEYNVVLQARGENRATVDDLGNLYVRSDRTGTMVPLSALMKVKPSFGPERALRYNGYLSADINGGAAPGFSSGQAQAAIERIAHETLPRGARLCRGRALPWDGEPRDEPMLWRWRSALTAPTRETRPLTMHVPDGFWEVAPTFVARPGE